MKFSSLQENLKQGMFIAGHIAGKNSGLPILNNLKIEAKAGNIKLTSTNLEIGVSCLIRGKVEEEGEYTIDAKLVADYINLLPNKKVDVIISEDGAEINCENYKTKIKGQSAEEYPLIPQIEKENAIVVNTSEFKKAIAQVAFAAANSEARIELSGILFVVNEKEVIMAATDSYRLAEKKLAIKNQGQISAKTIIPVKTIQEVLRILGGAKEDGVAEGNEVEIYLSENQIMFTSGSIEIVSRLIEGQYPDYKQIIPNLSKTSASVEVSQLVKAVKASSLFSKTGINDINLDFPQNKNRVIISSASGMTGENITEIETNVVGDDNGVVVNYRYILDGLNNVNDEFVKIEIVDNNTPCILRPEKDESYFYIIMPIKQ